MEQGSETTKQIIYLVYITNSHPYVLVSANKTREGAEKIQEAFSYYKTDIVEKELGE